MIPKLECEGFVTTLPRRGVQVRALTYLELVVPLKKRLYDFPRQTYWEWEQLNLDEHARFLGCIERGDRAGATDLIRDEHWGWKKHEPYFIKFYKFDAAQPGSPPSPRPRAGRR